VFLNCSGMRYVLVAFLVSWCVCCSKVRKKSCQISISFLPAKALLTPNLYSTLEIRQVWLGDCCVTINWQVPERSASATKIANGQELIHDCCFLTKLIHLHLNKCTFTIHFQVTTNLAFRSILYPSAFFTSVPSSRTSSITASRIRRHPLPCTCLFTSLDM
jgi:hypothetical protein